MPTVSSSMDYHGFPAGQLSKCKLLRLKDYAFFCLFVLEFLFVWFFKTFRFLISILFNVSLRVWFLYPEKLITLKTWAHTAFEPLIFLLKEMVVIILLFSILYLNLQLFSVLNEPSFFKLHLISSISFW